MLKRNVRTAMAFALAIPAFQLPVYAESSTVTEETMDGTIISVEDNYETPVGYEDENYSHLIIESLISGPGADKANLDVAYNINILSLDEELPWPDDFYYTSSNGSGTLYDGIGTIHLKGTGEISIMIPADSVCVIMPSVKGNYLVPEIIKFNVEAEKEYTASIDVKAAGALTTTGALLTNANVVFPKELGNQFKVGDSREARIDNYSDKITWSLAVNSGDTSGSFKLVSKSGKTYVQAVKAGKITLVGKTSNGVKLTKKLTCVVPVTTGWKTVSGKKYYYNAKGQKVTGFQKIDNKWYYFTSAGVMTTGWQKVAGKWYYMNSSGVRQVGWQKISYKGKLCWFYFNANGVMMTGWQKVSGKWYYMDGNGVMLTNWQKLKDSKGTFWFYLGSDGACRYGWQTINYNGKARKFYFDSMGHMLTGKQKIGNKWYTFNSDGTLK